MTSSSVIVLGDDGGDASATARIAAIDLARRSGATLVLVHAIEHPDESGPRARRELRDLLLDGCSGIDTRLHINHGDAVDMLLAEARRHRAMLIVTGHRHRSRVGRWIFGSVAEGLMESSQVPLLIVPKEADWPPQRFLVGDDGTAAARSAGDFAARLSRMLDAKIRLIEMLPRADLFGDLDAEHHVVEAGRHLRGRALDLSRVSGRPAGVEVHFAGAVDMLERLAERTTSRTCIVVGRRRRSDAPLSLPHVSDELLRHGVNCLLVHPALADAGVPAAGPAV